MFLMNFRIAIFNHKSIEWGVYGYGTIDSGAQWNPNPRAGSKGWIGIWEGVKEHLHLSTLGGTEQETPVPCGEETWQIPGHWSQIPYHSDSLSFG